MTIPIKRIRLKLMWLLVPVYFLLADPTTLSILAGLPLALAGGALRAWAAGTIHKNKVLSTGGPYAYTRNPLYLGTFLLGLGVATASGQPLLVAAFLAFFAVVYVETIRREEARLAALFGADYHAYAARVPRLFPRPWRRAAPEGAARASEVARFRLGRYLGNREYQMLLGLTAVFIILSVMAALDA
ncbi:MAG TPA: isoprenylcysteine carboxylmethyltransferase family protein [Longimicrobiales bacterium]|nr:isoprenylcysteine carboxylmethyltransferase family protein [Longimicrobiales bacterium]